MSLSEFLIIKLDGNSVGDKCNKTEIYLITARHSWLAVVVPSAETVNQGKGIEKHYGKGCS